MAQAEREVRLAEQKLAKCRVKESMLKARLYKIQIAMARRLVQLSETQIGRARAGVEYVVEHRVRPQMINHFVSEALPG